MKVRMEDDIVGYSGTLIQALVPSICAIGLIWSRWVLGLVQICYCIGFAFMPPLSIVRVVDMFSL